MREEILDILHEGHLGQEKTKSTELPTLKNRKSDQLRSYVMETPEGAQYRRNTRHLLKTSTSSGRSTSEPDTTMTSSMRTTTPTAEPTPEQYTTRSGRSVKPSVKLDL
ncbi:hypothetical protein Bbelb_110790 [Branchiostoma belcheri]|nr:hypothetical protein Bbelb_110790 [Branchiostoma belcheri]